jgi:hypothetical protein
MDHLEVVKYLISKSAKIYTSDPKSEEMAEKREVLCRHIFVPLFNTISCKYCGIDQDKVKK